MVENNGNRPDPYEAVRGYVEDDGPREWRWKEKAKDFYSIAEAFRLYFFSPRKPGDYELPPILVGVESLSVRTLACYHLTENPLGLRFQMSVNSLYLDRPMWEQYETLLHEMIHLYQENAPGLEKSKHGYHNNQFVSIAEELGLHPLPIFGCHWKPADGQFERLMQRYEIPKPEHANGEFRKPSEKKEKGEAWWDADRGTAKGTSTLLKFTCACKPPFNVRTGRDNLRALCLACNEEFRVVS